MAELRLTVTDNVTEYNITVTDNGNVITVSPTVRVDRSENNIDGGRADSIYTLPQQINGGNAL